MKRKEFLENVLEYVWEDAKIPPGKLTIWLVLITIVTSICRLLKSAVKKDRVRNLNVLFLTQGTTMMIHLPTIYWGLNYILLIHVKIPAIQTHA